MENQSGSIEQFIPLNKPENESQDNEKQELERLIASRWRLWFPNPHENLFHIYYVLFNGLRQRLAMATLAILYCAYAFFVFLNYGIAGGSAGLYLALPVIASTAIAAWFTNRDTWLQLLSGLGLAIAGFGIGWLLMASATFGGALVSGLALTALILWAYIPSGMRFEYALPCAAWLSLAAIYGIEVNPVIPGYVAHLLAGQIIIVHFMAGMAGYRTEAEIRAGYLNGRLARLAHAELIELVGVDDVTGLANNRRMNDFYANTWDRARRDQVEIAVLVLDIDFLWVLNKQFGRSIGDICIRKIGAVIGHYCRRPGDLAARARGGMFYMILYACSEKNAKMIAERILKDVSSLNMFNPGSEVSWVVTMSAGVHAVIPARASSKESALVAAQTNLHIAKRSGRNRAICSLDAMPPNVQAIHSAPRLEVEKTEIIREMRK